MSNTGRAVIGPQPPARAPWYVNPGFWRAAFFLFLAVLPVLFSTFTLENFEYPKAMWLRAAALCFLAPTLVIVVSRLAQARLGGMHDLRNRLLHALKNELMSVGVLLFLLSALLSTLFSVNPQISWWGEHTSYAGFVTIAAHVVVYFAARTLANGMATVERLLGACVLAGLVASTYALLQFCGLDPLGCEFTSNAGVFLRPFGTLGHPNHLGAYLAILFPVLLYFASAESSAIGATSWQGRAVAIHRGGMALLGLVFLGGMLLALSRAAWIGWAAGIVCWLVVLFRLRGQLPRFKSIAWRALAGVFVIGVIWMWNPHEIASGLVDRVTNIKSGWTRFIIWEKSVEIWREHPVFGIGPDTFQLAFAPRRTAEFWDHEWDTTPTRAHNEFLQVLATQGIVGGIASVIFLIGLVQTSRRALRRDEPRTPYLASALLAGCVVFLGLSLFSFTAVGYGPAFMTLAGFLSRLGSSIHTGNDRDETCAWFRPALLFSASVMLVGFAWETSRGFATAPTVFWCAIVAIGSVLAACVLFFLRIWAPPIPAARTVPNAGAVVTPNRWIAVAVLGVVGAGMVFLVILPWLGHRACADSELFLASDPKRARQCLDKAVWLDPSCEIYWTKLAFVHRMLADQATNADERNARLRDARTIWDQLILRSPRNGSYHGNRGVCLALQCQQGLAPSEDVFRSFEIALRLEPANPLFHADAADAALRLGQNDLAWRYAQAGLQKNARYGPLYAQVGYLCLQRGEFAEAIKQLDKSLISYWEEHDDRKKAAEANRAVAHYWLEKGTHRASRAP